ncbi:hypothetical protein BDK51DRAFT_52392 [Blyttiomyces helicus]|uniref:Uncharacterized protein n=1 Tax=Blyttiomyces helicus TaxID=388810 RepID=A0A4P9WGR3_9FUNG|nr:hypothetical protein BDK51DRAFT_52392 [Blyttiomyces helicus]|eukprot:RKO91115.1 hypothetical protein BDK51DRAFT_52392 [Blyttiomyces helicus]
MALRAGSRVNPQSSPNTCGSTNLVQAGALTHRKALGQRILPPGFGCPAALAPLCLTLKLLHSQAQNAARMFAASMGKELDLLRKMPQNELHMSITFTVSIRAALACLTLAARHIKLVVRRKRTSLDWRSFPDGEPAWASFQRVPAVHTPCTVCVMIHQDVLRRPVLQKKIYGAIWSRSRSANLSVHSSGFPAVHTFPYRMNCQDSTVSR